MKSWHFRYLFLGILIAVMGIMLSGASQTLGVAIDWRIVTADCGMERTGVFSWTFARTSPNDTDLPVVLLASILGAITLLFYYAVPLFRGRPSPGSCIFGYQVLSDTRNPLTIRQSLLRPLLGFAAVGVAYIAPVIGCDKAKGKFWLDRIFATRATILS